MTGGQGVAGSNPAVPTGSLLFSNILPLRKSQQKSQLVVQRPLHRPAPRVPRRPTRTCAKTAEQASSPVKAPKITEPPRICTTTPDTIPRPPADRRPDAHRGTAAAGAGMPGCSSQACPRRRSREAAGIRAAPRTGRHDRSDLHRLPGNKAASSLWRKCRPGQCAIPANEFSTLKLAARQMPSRNKCA